MRLIKLKMNSSRSEFDFFAICSRHSFCRTINSALSVKFVQQFLLQHLGPLNRSCESPLQNQLTQVADGMLQNSPTHSYQPPYTPRSDTRLKSAIANLSNIGTSCSTSGGSSMPAELSPAASSTQSSTSAGSEGSLLPSSSCKALIHALGAVAPRLVN